MRIRHILVTVFVATAALCLAGNGVEKYVVYNTKAYPLSVLDLSRTELAQQHKELLSAPLRGDVLAFRVYAGRALVRQVVGTIVSTNRLVCRDGYRLEIFYDEEAVIDLLRTLAKTDVMMHTPQFY